MFRLHQATTDDFNDVGDGKRLNGEIWFRKDLGEIRGFLNGMVRTLFDIDGRPGNGIKRLKIIRNFSDFAIADTKKQITLVTLPAGAEVLSANAEVTTPWNGGDTVTISVGSAPSPIALLTAQDIKTIGFKDLIGAKLTTGRGMFSSVDPVAIVAEAKSTNVNLDQSSQGVITFFMTWIEY